MKYTLFLLGFCCLAWFACNRSKNTTENPAPPTEARSDRQGPPPGGQGRTPNIDELLLRMDANGNGQLEKAEVRGPLADNFDQVDTNQDGVLSREELEKAPRPPRGSRGNGG